MANNDFRARPSLPGPARALAALARFLLLLLAFWPGAGHAVPGKRLGPAASSLPVLCYHQVARRATDDLTISSQDFARHMAYLRQAGYTPVRLEQARLFWWGARNLPGKPILITFDDGYEGVYKYALPVLLRYRFPATMFLVVGHVGARKPVQHVSWIECRKMRDSHLFEFGSHTYDLHCFIRERLLGGGIFPDQVVRDLRKSRCVLQQRLGVKTSAFAWPYGRYNAITLPLAAKAGFTMQFTIDFGSTHSYEGTNRIHRYLIRAEDRDVRVFRRKLALCRSW